MGDANELPGRLVPAVLSVAAAALLVFGTSCSSAPTSVEPASIDTTPIDTTPIDATPIDATLTDDEIAGLRWMREEEQLAHDVYVVLGDLWGLRIFEKIAASEATHIDAVSGLLGRYGIDDPAAGNEPGTFADLRLQGLYDRLIADGSRSPDGALRVGALIEELDIGDLQARSAATEVPEIIAVYANLERGSRNHLRAFTSQLESRGETYEPTQLGT